LFFAVMNWEAAAMCRRLGGGNQSSLPTILSTE
jgi:hypothetical protein